MDRINIIIKLKKEKVKREKIGIFIDEFLYHFSKLNFNLKIVLLYNSELLIEDVKLCLNESNYHINFVPLNAKDLLAKKNILVQKDFTIIEVDVRKEFKVHKVIEAFIDFLDNEYDILFSSELTRIKEYSHNGTIINNELVLLKNDCFSIFRAENYFNDIKNLYNKNVGFYKVSKEEISEIEKIVQFRKSYNVRLILKMEKIKMILTDSDGVLTDGGMYYSNYGDEIKKFNTRDGKGFELLKKNGYKVGIISGENIDLLKRRGQKLQVDELHIGIKNKLMILDDICYRHNLNYDEIAYLGDDINDLSIINRVGLSFSVLDAEKIVKSSVDYVLKSKGGSGAFREVANLFLSEY